MNANDPVELAAKYGMEEDLSQTMPEGWQGRARRSATATPYRSRILGNKNTALRPLDEPQGSIPFAAALLLLFLGALCWLGVMLALIDGRPIIGMVCVAASFCFFALLCFILAAIKELSAITIRVARRQKTGEPI